MKLKGMAEVLRSGITIYNGNKVAAMRRGKFGGKLFTVIDSDEDYSIVTRDVNTALLCLGIAEEVM